MNKLSFGFTGESSSIQKFSIKLGQWWYIFFATASSAVISISASFAVIAIKEAFNNLDPRYEQAARTLGCNKVTAFTKVVFPLIKTGIVSGGVMTWTRAVGEFVPILLLCGAQRGKTEIMPIAIFLEFEVGNIEGAVGLTIIFLVLSSLYLALFKNFLLNRAGQKV